MSNKENDRGLAVLVVSNVRNLPGTHEWKENLVNSIMDGFAAVRMDASQGTETVWNGHTNECALRYFSDATKKQYPLGNAPPDWNEQCPECDCGRDDIEGGRL